MNALVELGLLFKSFSLKDKVNSSSTSINCILNFKKSSRYFSRWRIITMKTIFPVCSRGTNNYLQVVGRRWKIFYNMNMCVTRPKHFGNFIVMTRMEWWESERRMQRRKSREGDGKRRTAKGSKGQKKRKKLGILTVNCKKLGRCGSFMREVLSSVPSVLNSIGMAMYRNQH